MSYPIGLLVVIASVVLAACSEVGREELPSIPAPEMYATTRVNDVDLTLRSDNGRCLLEYTTDPRFQPLGAGNNTVLLDMDAPCNFVRIPRRPEEPQAYAVPNDGLTGRKILLIVGGKPHPAAQGESASDQFMPAGCGSWMQKIVVFKHEIRVDFPATQPGGNLCPSGGMDEVFFAA